MIPNHRLHRCLQRRIIRDIRAAEGAVRRPAHILMEHAMWINTPHARLGLSARRALRLKDARGARLRAVQGTLWVTIDNDLRDIVLDAGESSVVDSDQPLRSAMARISSLEKVS